MSRPKRLSLFNFGNKYDHRIYLVIEHKDADIGRNTLVKTDPPMINKIVREATLGEDRKMKGVLKKCD